ncbi:MAG TPA: sigma 54-interacting transcriptional regulator [Candidatus Binataceae bacterium]|nr:sigma 54-interacting transcriptional regulator [Candidatus Binataceae bacterium]
MSQASDIAGEGFDLDLWIKASEAVSGEIVLDKLIHILMSKALEHAKARRGVLLLPHGDELHAEAEATAAGDTVTICFAPDAPISELLPESVLNEAIRTHEIVTLSDASLAEPFASDHYVRRTHALSVLCVPLMKQARRIGVLYLEDNLAPNVFSARSIRLLKLLASQAAISLENAQLYRDLQRSEAFLTQGEEVARTGTWALDLATGHSRWSRQMFRIFGMDPSDSPPVMPDFLDLVHPEDRQHVRRTLAAAGAQGAPFDYTFRIIRPNGEQSYLRSVGSPVSQSGELKSYFGTIVDVTEHELMTRELRGREEELRNILDYAPQQIAIIGPDGSRLNANRVALDYAGMTLEEFRSPEYEKLIHPEDAERLRLDPPFGGAKEFEFETRIRGKDGQYRWFLVRFFPLRDSDGNILRWYSVGTEIQNRKLAEERVRNENLALREEVDKASLFEEVIGASPALHAVIARVAKVAPTDSTVLITGETGTGKELIARAIHKSSARAAAAFVSVNCAGIPQSLIASELFGHEKGAFTGALQRRIGRFEMAQGGTLFLDEVGDLPAETQVTLLRVLQEHEFERVGGERLIRADVRLITATNRDLAVAIEAGAFRRDLFYRLNVFPIELPPLRERSDDIPMLVEYFIERYATSAGKKIKNIDRKSMDLLRSYPWPGNVRELQNVIERSVILCDTETFSVDESWLPLDPPQPAPDAHQPLVRAIEKQERDTIEKALAETRGRVAGPMGAAAKLGMRPSTLESKIRTLRINKHLFRGI